MEQRQQKNWPGQQVSPASSIQNFLQGSAAVRWTCIHTHIGSGRAVCAKGRRNQWCVVARWAAWRIWCKETRPAAVTHTHTHKGVWSYQWPAGAVEAAEFVFSYTSWVVKWVLKHAAKKTLSHCCCSTTLTPADLLGAVWVIRLQKVLFSWWWNLYSYTTYACAPKRTYTHKQDS